MPDPVPSQARVVIIGAGIVGCSVAYHLTLRGWTDVVVVEQGTLTCGTTWHAAGLVGQLRATKNMTVLARYTAELYSNLESETGQPTGFRATGSLSVASNEERFEELLRGASMAQTVDLEVEVLTPEEAGAKWPLMNTADVVGAVYLPGDGDTSPVDTTMAMAKGARARGASIVEETRVTNILVHKGTACGVVTDRGKIGAEHVVICAGMWSRQLARKIGVVIPLQACEHFYLVTEPIEGLEPNLPTLRDPDGYSYIKEEAGKLLVGFFEPLAKPWSLEGVPDDFAFGQLPEDWDHIGPIFEKSIHRIPVLGDVGIQLLFNAPEAFTPDGRYYLGETPEARNLYVAAGFNSVGIQSAGGAGMALADWIVDGYPPMDLSDVDIRRVMPYQASTAFLRERAAESLGLLYAMHWPFMQYETARGMRTSPFYERLAAAGACFGELAGWERPNWYAPPEVEPRYEYSYRRQNWFEYSAAEHETVRSSVGLFDQTSFAKFFVQGPDSEAVLNRVCANDVSAPPGKVVYTQWLNERGGIEADLTVTRLAHDEYLVVTSGTSQVRDFHWLRRHITDAANVILTDMTSGLAVLGLMGPNSRGLLSRLTDADLSNEAFRFGTAQTIDVAQIAVRALRISYVGELGWELYIPTEYATYVYDAVVAQGEDFGLRHAGFHAMNSLRIESGYRHWGDDITDEDTPLEAGLGFAVAFEKAGGFIGREALLSQREQPRRKRLVQFKLVDPEPLLYHDEPIFRDGTLVGRTTSAMFGHTVGAAIAMGYVFHEEGVTKEYLDSGKFEIEAAGVRMPAHTSLRSFYDPRSERLRM